MPSPLNNVFFNWAALVALCALPYVKLRDQLGLETPEALQWSLVAIGAAGTIAVFSVARQASRSRRAARARVASRPH